MGGPVIVSAKRFRRSVVFIVFEIISVDLGPFALLDPPLPGGALQLHLYGDMWP